MMWEVHDIFDILLRNHISVASIVLTLLPEAVLCKHRCCHEDCKSTQKIVNVRGLWLSTQDDDEYIYGCIHAMLTLGPFRYLLLLRFYFRIIVLFVTFRFQLSAEV